MARLRAIETRRSLVRNAADGASGIWDSCGRSVVRSTQEAITRPTLLGAMPLDVRSSLYVVWGDWPIVLVAVVVLLAGLRRRAPLPVVTGRRDRSPRFPIA
jgi:apolipoprotein N-acyltransferase